MCTYLTEKIDVDGSGKGATGWFGASQATVYVDHPVHAPYGHTVNIDVLNPALGPSARVALELTEETAACAGRSNPPRHRLRPRGLGLEESNRLTGTATATSQPAARCANGFDQRVVTVELQPDRVAARDEQQQFLRFAGHGQLRPAADGGQRPCPPACAATLARVPWPSVSRAMIGSPRPSAFTVASSSCLGSQPVWARRTSSWWMNISPMFATGSRSLNGEYSGGPEAILSSSSSQSVDCGDLTFDLGGVAGEERECDPRRGVQPALPDHQMSGEVAGRPVATECGRVGSDGAHGFNECSAFTLSCGHCSTLERLHPVDGDNHAVVGAVVGEPGAVLARVDGPAHRASTSGSRG